MCGHDLQRVPLMLSRVVPGAAVAYSVVWVAGSGSWPVGLRLLEFGVCAVLSGCTGGQLLAVTHSWPGVVVTT